MSYLGKKGYTLLKNEMTNEDIEDCKRELKVKPFVIQEYANHVQSFPIYLSYPQNTLPF